MTAVKYDITIEQGATFTDVITYKNRDGSPINLTGYTARSHGRKSIDSTNKTFDLTTENGGLVLGGALGTITRTITASQTTKLSGNGIYDLELIAGDEVTRLIEGAYSVVPNVTR